MLRERSCTCDMCNMNTWKEEYEEYRDKIINKPSKWKELKKINQQIEGIDMWLDDYVEIGFEKECLKYAYDNREPWLMNYLE